MAVSVPARGLLESRARTGRRVLADRWASRLVVVGGLVIIASILAILFVILAEVYPLFQPARARTLATIELGGGAPPATLGADEYREVAYGISADGLRLVSLKTGAALGTGAVAPPAGTRFNAVSAVEKDRYLLGTSDGRAFPLGVTFTADFKDGQRTVIPAVALGPPMELDATRKRPVLRLAAAAPKEGALTVAQLGPAELVMDTVVEKKALIGPGTREEVVVPLPLQIDGEISALALDGRGEDLFVGTSRGQVVRYDLRDRANPTLAESVDVAGTPGTRITALAFLLGDRTLVAGDERGGVSTWQVVPPPHGATRRLTRVHQFASHAAPVVAVAASRRDKSFLTGDASGDIHLSYGTSGETLLTLKATGSRLTALALAPKGDGVLAADAAGKVAHWQLDNRHPEITLHTLFGTVWYEGYSEPAYVWQSTGGTDDFEAKFSLTPLVFGTLKGTLYALMVAVPVALLAALYVSEFMHPNVKGYVKPGVEIMAALPSVVLGFLAGLWLAPWMERVAPGFILLIPVEAASILAAMLLWRALPLRLRAPFRPGTEVFLLVPVVIAGAGLAFVLSGLIETRLMGGDYRGWLLSTLGLTYDQRNSLVVGVAMGFAVIPIIFTIAEDSLSNVPAHLRAGSLALGATRWQTAVRVVLPTASPGIFSAVMIGFGRAVGETMIVLMATGNTPVMDWSIFNGFRALSANIAVELPEAPEGGTLFRVLFVAALLLFCFTFAVNTVAELVRLRLRRKYRYL